MATINACFCTKCIFYLRLNQGGREPSCLRRRRAGRWASQPSLVTRQNRDRQNLDRQKRDRQNLERQNWDKLTLVVDNVGSCVKSPQILHVLVHIILEDSPRNFGLALKFSQIPFHGDRRSCETSIKVNIINQSNKQTHKQTILDGLTPK